MEVEVWVFEDGAEWQRIGPDEWVGGPITEQPGTLTHDQFRQLAAQHDVTVETRTEV
jgi:hypothetical protein